MPWKIKGRVFKNPPPAPGLPLGTLGLLGCGLVCGLVLPGVVRPPVFDPGLFLPPPGRVLLPPLFLGGAFLLFLPGNN